LVQGNAGRSGCVLGFCKQVSEQPLQNPAGDVGGEEWTKRVLGQGLWWVLDTALPGRVALLQHTWDLELVKKFFSAVSVQ